MLQDPDPFRQDAPAATDDDLTALVEGGPVSRGLGRALVAEEAQITDRLFGFIASDDRRSFDAQQARVFGERYRNELTPEEATRRFGVEGYLDFDRPVNVHRAAEMNRQAVARRYREETAARAELSQLETIGASLVGSATDPVLLPTWFIGGGSASLRALRIAPAATRGGAVMRGAAVGLIDGVTGGVAAESINAAARLGAGEDYNGGDFLRNVLFGAAVGGTVGGVTGGVVGPARARPRGAVADLIVREATALGEDADVALRIAQLESGLNPRARNPRSSAGGLYQFIDSTWSRFGGGNKFDPQRSANAGLRLQAENRAGLRGELGREPQGWELYLAHQQGLGGATELLRDPNRPAVDALRAAGVRNPARALSLNGGDASMTAGEFAGHWRRKYGEGGASIESLTPQVMPPVLRGLTDNERVGGFAEAVEAMAEDAPLDLGALAARNGLDTLDEASAAPSIRGRWLETDVAVTRGGGEIPVRFAVVELDDLVTSHDDDLTAVAGYPQALQPRDRSRAGSQAANFELERDLNPALLMRDKAASGGAPVVSPDGLVESGNGRAIALRRSARTGTPAWGRYVAELKAQGIETEGFSRPVLVRMRAEPMTGAARVEMARQLNISQTEGFSPVEQARADARRLDKATLDLLSGDDPFAAAERPFLRGFVARVAANDANAVTDARGAISAAGRSRVQAALVQAAYGDDALTAALFEAADPAIRGIGQGLAEAAPAWARMRAEAPPHLDLTANLTGAVAMIRAAKAARQSAGDWLAVRLGQGDMFGGEAISPETEAMIRLMFRDEGLTKPRAAERIAEALKDYARSAAATPAGPDLFGETPDGRAFLETLLARQDDAEGAGRTGLSYAGGSEPLWSSREIGAAGLDLRPVEPVRDGPGGGGQRPGDGEGAEGQGRGDAAGSGDRPLDPAAEAEATALAVAEVRAELGQLEAQAKTATAVVETRGLGVQYHGARGPITSLQEGYSNDANIYGGFETFYTTDAADIATGYFRKQPDAVLYAAREREAVEFFDMEEGKPVKEWERLFGLDDDFMGLAVEEASLEHGPTPNLRQIMDEARAQSRGEGLSRSDVQEYFDGITDTLQREGFGGMRHIGGLLTQRAPHEVKIYFRPHEQIELQAVPVPRADIPGDLASKISETTQRLRQAEARAAAAVNKVEAQKAAAAADAGRVARLAAFIADDPELKALMADTEALATAGGLDLPGFEPSTEPSTVAEAIRAAAFCLASETVA